jgi:hypothetical protein
MRWCRREAKRSDACLATEEKEISIFAVEGDVLGKTGRRRLDELRDAFEPERYGRFFPL